MGKLQAKEKMTDSTKVTIVVLALGVLAIGGLVRGCTESGATDREAIKAGLEQSIRDGRAIWTKPQPK
jgi:hypothetical protein